MMNERNIRVREFPKILEMLAALDGGDFKALPEWKALETMNTTTGHYFRGVE